MRDILRKFCVTGFVMAFLPCLQTAESFTVASFQNSSQSSNRPSLIVIGGWNSPTLYFGETIRIIPGDLNYGTELNIPIAERNIPIAEWIIPINEFAEDENLLGIWAQNVAFLDGHFYEISLTDQQFNFALPDINSFPVPEPATIAILGLGGLVLIRRKRSA